MEGRSWVMSYLTAQRAHVFRFVIQKYAVLSLYALAFSIYEDDADLEEGELEKKTLYVILREMT